jgi:hypothetical protein
MAENALQRRVRARFAGKREVGLDSNTIDRRLRLGREAADAEDVSWPRSAADVNPIAAALARASKGKR